MFIDKKRQITYQDAIAEALYQAMSSDDNVYVIGLGVSDYKGIFGTTLNLMRHFGPDRVIEAPASENALTGIAVGSAAFGKRPVLVHARNDFMFLAMDEMINAASKWKYMYAGKSQAPIVVRGIIGKGWGQGPTHSQSIQSVIAHFPGIYVAMPSTPYDAKGFLLSSLKGSVPCVIMEHRRLYNTIGEVPEEKYSCPFGKGRIVKKGSDVTLAAASLMVEEGVKACLALKKMGIHLEVIDPRTLCPLDENIILKSVRKTGRLIVADTSWVSYGFASEIAGLIASNGYHLLKKPVSRIGLKPCPSPVSKPLEDEFYPTYKDIFLKACKLLDRKPDLELIKDPIVDSFKGPY